MQHDLIVLCPSYRRFTSIHSTTFTVGLPQRSGVLGAGGESKGCVPSITPAFTEFSCMMDNTCPVDGMTEVLEVPSGRIVHFGTVASQGVVPVGVWETEGCVGWRARKALLLDFWDVWAGQRKW